MGLATQPPRLLVKRFRGRLLRRVRWLLLRLLNGPTSRQLKRTHIGRFGTMLLRVTVCGLALCLLPPLLLLATRSKSLLSPCRSTSR